MVGQACAELHHRHSKQAHQEAIRITDMADLTALRGRDLCVGAKLQWKTLAQAALQCDSIWLQPIRRCHVLPKL